VSVGSKTLSTDTDVIRIEGNIGDGEFSPVIRGSVRLKPLTGLRTSTVALATTAPVGSTTVPVTEVELPPDCALALGSKSQRKNE